MQTYVGTWTAVRRYGSPAADTTVPACAAMARRVSRRRRHRESLSRAGQFWCRPVSTEFAGGVTSKSTFRSRCRTAGQALTLVGSQRSGPQELLGPELPPCLRAFKRARSRGLDNLDESENLPTAMTGLLTVAACEAGSAGACGAKCLCRQRAAPSRSGGGGGFDCSLPMNRRFHRTGTRRTVQFVIVVDHASRPLPRALGDLRPAGRINSNAIAWDNRGAWAWRGDCQAASMPPLIAQNYSRPGDRLSIADPGRGGPRFRPSATHRDPPVNIGLSAEAVAARRAEIFELVSPADTCLCSGNERGRGGQPHHPHLPQHSMTNVFTGVRR